MSLTVSVPTGWEAVARGATQRTAMNLTWVRVPIGLVIAGTMLSRSFILGTVALLAFVAIDVLDGQVARSNGGDTAERRALDSAVDRCVTPAAMLVAGVAVPALAVLGGLLLLVSALAAPHARYTMRTFGVVLRAPSWHKSWSLSLVAAGLLYLGGLDALAVWTASVGVVLAAVCTYELWKIHRSLRTQHG